MNEQLTRDTVRAGVRGFVYFLAVLMCCIRSDAGFFHAPWPLLASVPEPTVGSEK